MHDTASSTPQRPPLQPAAKYYAELTGLPSYRVYDLIRQGCLPVVRVGRRVMVDPLRAEKWIDAGGSGIER